MEQFGTALKARFPRIQYWVCNVEKPRGRYETQPVPPSVDVVVVDGFFDKSPGGVRGKTDDCLPGWLAKAQGRPVLYRWYSWPFQPRECDHGPCRHVSRLPRSTACPESSSGNTVRMQTPRVPVRRASSPIPLVQEIREAAGKLGISGGGSGDKEAVGKVATRETRPEEKGERLPSPPPAPQVESRESTDLSKARPAEEILRPGRSNCPRRRSRGA